jgi:hypothetical protein
LSKNVEVKARIDEIVRPLAKRAGYTLDNLVSRIEAATAAAQADGAHGAVAQNHSLILKIIELVEERNAAEQYQFGGAQTAEEILSLIRDSFGDVVAAVIGAAVVGDVYANDLDKALEIIDQIRADLIARVAAKAKLVS